MKGEINVAPAMRPVHRMIINDRESANDRVSRINRGCAGRDDVSEKNVCVDSVRS